MKNFQRFFFLLTLLLPAACSKPESPAAAADSGAPAAAVKQVLLDPAAAQDAGIEITEAGPATLQELLPLYGVIQSDAERLRQVGARYAGVVRSVLVVAGEAVRAGQTLATVESNDSLQTYAVTAPIAGVVTVRQANPGEAVGDKPLFTVADLSSVRAELSVFPRDRGRLHLGQKVSVSAGDAGPTGAGLIGFISPLGSETNQSVAVRVVLKNPDGRWSAGLFVNAEVGLGEFPAAVAVQNGALQTLDGETVVFVRNAQGFVARPIKPGRADGHHTEVLSGLTAGERYASANSFVLKAELGKPGAEE